MTTLIFNLFFWALFQTQIAAVKTQDCGGFEVIRPKSAKINGDSLIVIGNVKSCNERVAAPFSSIRFFNKTGKVMANAIASENGKYSLRLRRGYYKLEARNIPFGESQTPLINCQYGDTLRIDLYLLSPQ